MHPVRMKRSSAEQELSQDGVAGHPRWDPKGSELFFTKNNRLMSLPVTLEPKPEIGAPKVLFDATEVGIELWRGFDVDAGGDRFVAIQKVDWNEGPNSIIVVENWFEEFRRND